MVSASLLTAILSHPSERFLDVSGVSVLEMFRNIDHDGSGVIEKEEFEAELKKRTDLGVLQPQVG